MSRNLSVKLHRYYFPKNNSTQIHNFLKFKKKFLTRLYLNEIEESKYSEIFKKYLIQKCFNETITENDFDFEKLLEHDNYLKNYNIDFNVLKNFRIILLKKGDFSIDQINMFLEKNKISDDKLELLFENLTNNFWFKDI